MKGCHMYKVVQRLKHLKKPLNKLNWKNGNLFVKANSLKEKLKELQSKMDDDPSNLTKRQNAVELVNEYTIVAEDELKLLHQKARIQWLKEGDKNSAYFHNILKARKNKSIIESICCEDGSRVEGNLVNGQFVKNFQKLFGTNLPVSSMNSMGDIVKLKLSEAKVLDMIKEELLKGYNRRSGAKRCAMIIDIQKAYDTERISNLSLPFHSCNRDDLMVLCNGETESLKLVKRSMDEFSRVSGLFLNLSKSTIFFRSISEALKEDMLNILPFKCGKLLMKYLGVPLLAKRLESQVVTKTVLSYAGRIQLIASVLSTMQQHWSSVYMLFISIVNGLEKLFKSDSHRWKELMRIRDKIKPYVKFRIGNGRSISVWHDKWCDLGPLDRFIHNRDIYDVWMSNEDCLADAILDGRWK
uniref:RNA-directed DNA polymerase, eukaryota, reverse transcriptase zinc-binding domain protein n=1 Tax=Tanacetum cinerariifolium TaxID=118510 RepID=A0A6L2LPU9_TANCI|nr:RNA-directed DNA polymerase, eukaryota, reverse transcriptase zinc-binding domain protein [Tanacetum cinerariifolium]